MTLPLTEHARILLLIKDSLETPLIWHERQIKTPVDLSIGKNMCKEKMVELKSKNIPSNPNLLADKIQAALDKICNSGKEA